eukprot:12052157-Ditylum_brightwellii.AAC.1
MILSSLEALVVKWGSLRRQPGGGIRGLYGRGGGLVGVAIIGPSLLTVVTKRGERRNGGAGWRGLTGA